MQHLRPEDILHKSHLNRLLIEIIDQPTLAHSLVFKGGTCAAMLGYLDRFSVDLDFDLKGDVDTKTARQAFHQVFEHLGLELRIEFDQALFFQLRYPNDPGQRSALKVSDLQVRANQIEVQYLAEIDRLMACHTVETMFANKLVAVTDRYERHQTIAGRDIYDIHHFFIQGYRYHIPVIEERTGLAAGDYLGKLIVFIQTKVTQRVINEDLNTLLPQQQFQQIRKVLLPETIALLTQEQNKL